MNELKVIHVTMEKSDIQLSQQMDAFDSVTVKFENSQFKKSIHFETTVEIAV